MSTLLFAVGGIMLAIGIITIGSGMPASALDFGNTLIATGTTAAVGGLIVIALAAVVAQLQRLGEALNLGRPLAEHGEPLAIAPERRVVPPQPFEPRGPVPPPEFPIPRPPFAPSLPNPEDATAESRRTEAPAPPTVEPKEAEPVSGSPPSEPPPAPEPIAEPVAPERKEARPKSPFDFMWPAPKRESERPQPVERPSAAEAPAPVPGFDAPRESEKPRTVAVLKSGVVDGMSYTLYVDGSIEAELPQGTLRFANIQELRAHLEKNG